MKAITVQQPWAEFLANGKKQYETRSWKTDYRGPIAIHAGASDQMWRSLYFEAPEFYYLLLDMFHENYADLPFGAVIAIGELTDCIKTDDMEVDPTEYLIGDFSPGRYAWKIENVSRVKPDYVSGKMGLWDYFST